MEKNYAKLLEVHKKTLKLLKINKACSSSLSLENILKKVMQEIANYLKCDLIHFFFVDKKEEKIIRYVDYCTPKELRPILDALVNMDLSFFPLKDAIFKKRKVIWITDVVNSNLVPLDFAKIFNMKTLVAIPLINKRKLLAVIIIVYTKNYQPFDKDKFDFCSKIANLITINLENTLLHEEIIHSLRTLEETQDYLLKSEKKAAIGEFASNIAHEIRNPLAAISASVKYILEKVNLDSQSKDLLEIISKESSRINNLLQEFLEYARPKNLKLSEANLVELLEETITLIDTFETYKIKWIRKYTKNFPLVWIDVEKIKQVFYNILLNSCTHIEKNGTITINLKYKKKHRNNNNYVIISISDNGKGIPEKLLPKIFNPFFSTVNNGTGMGLPISLQIVEAHNGFLNLTSQENKGTTVEIYLPV